MSSKSAMRMKILLHVCCGTCAIGLLNYFKKHDLTLFFYNPNIEPEEEYLKRLGAVRQVAQEFGLELIEDNYDNVVWHELADRYKDEPEGGERCRVCFWMRLENTGMTAKMKGFDSFGTTLSVNAWKDVDFINEKGKEIASGLGLSFFDFGLSKEKIKEICYAEKELAKKHNLYRQKYCGCLYGLQNQK